MSEYISRVYQSKRGFTFLELLVVMAIMLLVFGVIIIYGNVGDEQIRVYTDSASVIQTILRSRSLAITAYWPEGRRVCGYGFHIKNSKEYEIVRYDRLSDPSEPCRDVGMLGKNIATQYDVVVGSTGVLDTGVTFDLDQSLPGNNTIPFYILFRPPDPDIYFYRDDGSIFPDTVTEGSFLLKTDKGTKMRITVGLGGQVTYKPER